MRRLLLIGIAFYLVFLGGGNYYYLVFGVRVVHHLVITALVVIWLLYRGVSCRGLPTTSLNPCILALIGLWLISATFALDSRLAFESAWFFITHTIFFWMIVSLIQDGKRFWVYETIFLITVLLVAIAGAQVVAWFGTWMPLLNAELPFPPILPRLDQPFGVSTWLSAQVAPLVVLTMAWTFSLRKSVERTFFLALVGSLVFILALTGSRGGYISLASAGILFLLWRVWAYGTQGRWMKTVIVMVPIIGAVLALTILISRDFGRVGGDALRTDLWRSSAEMVQAYPLTGVGVGGFGRGHRIYRDATYVDDRLGTAHNVYLNTAAEIGIGGLIIIGGLTVLSFVSWRKQWEQTETAKEKLRLEAAAATLIGIGVHSLFDNFVQTSTVMLPLALAALCIASPQLVLAPPLYRLQQRWLPLGLALLMTAYGTGLLISDVAQARFIDSVSQQSVAAAQEAERIDPALRLYPLQEWYLVGSDPTTPLETAIAAYENAVALEPTWDIGWLNLGTLYLRSGDSQRALDAYQRAANVNGLNEGWLYWAQLAESENAVPDDEIIRAYAQSFIIPSRMRNAEFWRATPLRRAALVENADPSNLEVQYRYLLLVDASQAQNVVNREPTIAAEWWILGHHLLTVEQDMPGAYTAFNHAIQGNPSAGDWYVLRAYAQTDPYRRARDLRIAELLGVFYENLSLAKVELAPTEAEQQMEQIRFVGSRFVSQNFEAVLFQGRRAQFELLPSPLAIPLTTRELDVWYDLANSFIEQGNTDTARRVYELLLEQYPQEEEAQEALEAL